MKKNIKFFNGQYFSYLGAYKISYGKYKIERGKELLKNIVMMQ